MSENTEDVQAATEAGAGPVTPVTRLRKAIFAAQAMLPHGHADFFAVVDYLDAALAAVEQELAALRLSYENASRAHFEATKRIDSLTECQAALKEELDEEIDHNARLSAKLDETKHNCACDYDERGAVCLVHTRPVREARERIAALEAERDEMRKDKERVDWLEDPEHRDGLDWFPQIPDGTCMWLYSNDDGDPITEPTPYFREAIDAAMATHAEKAAS